MKDETLMNFTQKTQSKTHEEHDTEIAQTCQSLAFDSELVNKVQQN